MSIFVPEKIKVGYQERSDTYTGKLAYVIYYDSRGKLRKEASWENWRDKEIPFDDFDNEPIEGFVLNKKVGGYQYHYDMRQTYARVYDPRGFEIEISIPNLLYILENTDCIKGKGLVGDFVYAWNGTELLLLPTSAPEYEELCKKTETLIQDNYIKGSELVAGRTYTTIDGNEHVFLGKYPVWKDEYHISWHFPYVENYDPNTEYFKKTSPAFWFYEVSTGYHHHCSSVTRKFYGCSNENVADDFQQYLCKLNKDPEYSPINLSEFEISPYTKEEFIESFTDLRGWGKEFAFKNRDGKIKTIVLERVHCSDGENEHLWKQYNSWRTYYSPIDPLYGKRCTIEEWFDILKPVHIITFLENGEIYRKEF